MRELAHVLMEMNVHFYTGQQVTQNADIIFVTIRLDPVSMKLMQKGTAAKMAPIVPLHMGHMTCAALFMISEKCK